MSRGLKFKNVHSSTFGLYMKSDNRQILPNVADEYVYIPDKAGSILVKSEIEDRFITVRFFFKANTIEELRTKSIEIGNWLHSTKRERLEFDDEPLHYWMAKVSGSVDATENANTFEFSVTFRCEPYPYEREV
ncbi:phage tail family protein [Schinkia azotoformans]|uniref:distal tail protein Dit n=1 Tax=Schinkia azotoformans TaxID=1454 RepID=UPI002E1CC4BA|nr:distal tail protein Dit [Schinkia azotoformans]MED4354068.1 phage tail family protein [Schinkia azotoformans]